jgi:translation initiation factor 1
MNNKEDKKVYSTNPDFMPQNDSPEEVETLPPGKQNLIVNLDKKQRKGKQVTIVLNFIGNEDSLKELGKTLKSKCGVGGAVKDGEIIIQGDFRQKIKNLLDSMGYHCKLGN